jgi:phosphoglycerate dehydrogenase-like enzyme
LRARRSWWRARREQWRRWRWTRRWRKQQQWRKQLGRVEGRRVVFVGVVEQGREFVRLLYARSFRLLVCSS